MSWFPQPSASTLVQLPLRRRTVWRAITNQFENGERISLPDRAAGRVEWQLAYRDLSEAEASTIGDFFRAQRGSFGTFAFADPGANLLAWSEDYAKADWEHGLLALTGSIAGPEGGASAWSLVNGSPGPQALSQTLALHGAYTTCFSVYVRSATPTNITLRRGSSSTTVTASTRWKRAFLTGAVPGEEGATFRVEVPAGSAVEVWGLQVETGPYPSQYRATQEASGIYEQTSFASDELDLTATGPGLFACEFNLISKL